MERDGDWSFFECGQFGLDAQSLFLQLRDPLLGLLLGNYVFNHEVNVALPLAFDPVTLRLQSRTRCDRVPRKSLPFTVVVAYISLDQLRVFQFFRHPAEYKSFDVAQVDDPSVRTTPALTDH
ncbi:hypothetical protein AS156_35070 [Bradyrhizobium macuxiense]|uniref:Uncharacterized protein n=1 Tax=Bradyrhizobium macuxiense TaxID=1755647 RepID=A0A125Q9P8_9BRAD|nr:hypothetical protein AS156_35070 [Bradyrhizobium macuxiense]